MKFCLNLCNDINFEPDAVQPCCNVHAIAVPRFPFTGGRLDMAAYARHIQNVVEQLQKGGAVCRGCPECIEINAPQDSAARLLFRSVYAQAFVQLPMRVLRFVARPRRGLRHSACAPEP